MDDKIMQEWSDKWLVKQAKKCGLKIKFVELKDEKDNCNNSADNNTS